MPKKLPNYLTISRHGIYYLRYVFDGKDTRKSLKTRDPVIAKINSYHFGAIIMAGKHDLNRNYFSAWTLVADGITVKTDGTKEDSENATELDPTPWTGKYSNYAAFC